ncbi:MAG: hypothetical protein KGH78_04415, partial [Candidatus Micrarchaeota archaeon]|nr:hypothetical protein [Candidatus Micrarchaeota archaeon]
MIRIRREDEGKSAEWIYQKRMQEAFRIIDQYMSLPRSERDEFVMELAKDKEAVGILRELAATRERERNQEVRKLKEEEDEKALVPVRNHITFPETMSKVYHGLT